MGAGEFGTVFQIDSFQKQIAGCGCLTTCGGKPSPFIEEARIVTVQKEEQVSNPKNSIRVDLANFAIEPAPSQQPSGIDEKLDDDVSDLDENDEDGEVQYQRDYLINHVYRCGQFRYAMKQLRKDLKKHKLEASFDIACEATILSSLSHPNIVKIRAIMGIPGRPDNFGIILDRLNKTLRENIDQWAVDIKAASRVFLQRWKLKKSDKWNALFLQRLLAVYDIARAMEHLHQKQ